jgi:sporulation protein YlmC with PRC-barrel domain
MKRIGMMFVAIMASLVFVGGPLAAGKEATSEKMGSKQAMSAEKHGNIVSANRFIGTDIHNKQGETIGEVQDLVLNRQNGQVDFVVVSKGGLWGVGEERFAVPFKAFKATPEGDALTLTIDENKLANAPKLEEGMNEAEYSRRINEYYGQAPAFEGTGEKGMTGEKEQKMQKEHKKESY